MIVIYEFMENKKESLTLLETHSFLIKHWCSSCVSQNAEHCPAACEDKIQLKPAGQVFSAAGFTCHELSGDMHVLSCSVRHN